MIECWFDGACEPVNPGGTAAYGAVVLDGEKRLMEASEIFVPQRNPLATSNNVAEYSGFKRVLDFLIANELQRQQIVIRGDSNLVIQQMRGQWRIRQGFYVPIARECKELLLKFPNLALEWIPREQNGLADDLSKAELKRAGVVFKIQPE